MKNIFSQTLFCCGIIFFSCCTSALAMPTATQEEIAVSNAVSACLIPLKEGKDPDAVARKLGKRPLSEDAFQFFWSPILNKTGYVILPKLVILATSSKLVCAIMIRSVQADYFKAIIDSTFSAEKGFKDIKNETSDDRHSIEYSMDMDKGSLITSIDYSDNYHEGSMQGLITVAFTSKEAK